MCRVFSQIRAGGGRAPQFVFLTNGDGGRSASVVKWPYDNLYSKGLYQNAWFSWPDYADGNRVKPLILGYDWETTPELRKYFTIRFSWAFGSAKRPKNAPGAGTMQATWPWTDDYPQTPSYGATPQDLQSLSIAVDNGPIYGGLGRSARDKRSEFSTRNIAFPGVETQYGLYFGEQWDRVWTGNAPWVAPEKRFEGIPPFLFLTQWNEWSASRWGAASHPLATIPAVPDRFTGQTLSAGDSYFVDEFNPEYSRDSEPDRSDTGDNYYWQVVDNARRYKGARRVAAATAAIDFGLADFSVWPKVGLQYLDDAGDTFARIDAKGLGSDKSLDATNTVPLIYNNRTGRNDFLGAKTARGRNGDLTFWAQTAAPLTATRDIYWMNLYLRDLNRALPSWSGFQFLVRPDETGTLRLYSYAGSGLDWNWKATGAVVTSQVRGGQIAVRVAASALGLKAGEPLDLAFKWADNVVPYGETPDPTDFLVNGDCAPNGRFAYQFHSGPIAPSPLVSGQIYALQNRASGLVAQLFNTIGSARAEGTRIRLVPLETQARPDAQQWMAQADGGNIWRFQNFDSGHSLGGARRFKTEKSDDRARVWRSDDPRIETQWEVRRGENGAVRLVHRATGKALTVAKTARADGTENDNDNIVRLADVSESDAMQIWNLVPQRKYQ